MDDVHDNAHGYLDPNEWGGLDDPDEAMRRYYFDQWMDAIDAFVVGCLKV